MSRKKDAKTVWLEEGLKILTTKGPASLSIESLINATGKTKGSFYHHFKSREQYIEQLLEYYEKTTVDEIIEVTKQGNTPRARLKHLMDVAFQTSSDLELTIRAWAVYDPMVKTFRDRLDRRRLEHVKKLHISSGLGANKARILSYRDYSLFLGFQQLRHHFNNAEFRSILRGPYSKGE